jgi:DUF4097 and DUF4098 domain-containing protein YvlB
MKTCFIIALFILSLHNLHGQTEKETIKKELTFEKKALHNTLLIANINGSIDVEGYAGETILIEVVKTISGKTTPRLEKGKREIKLGIVDLADSIILYTDGVCPPFGKNKNRHSNHDGNWNYQWDNCDKKDKEYEYKMDFKVKIPIGTNLVVSTINEGNISVSRVSGEVKANHINGSIRMTELTQAAKAHTINGDVNIDFNINPSADCRFYSLNGDINANFKRGLSSLVSFKSFNGEFYSNLDELVALPIEVQKTASEKGTKYKVNGNRYRVGKGGAHLDFETFNGNVYLKEK